MGLISSSNTATLSLTGIRQWISGVGALSVPGTSNLSLTALEMCFMGQNITGGPNVIVTNSKACMWQQQEKYYAGNVYAFDPSTSPKAWNYNAPAVGMDPYTPSRVTEFQQTYNPPPACVANGQATGAKDSTGNIVMVFTGGSPVNNIGSAYYFFIDTGAVNMGTQSGKVGVWTAVGASAAGATTTLTTVNNGCSFTGWVVDDKFCGGQMVASEIRIGGSRSYP